MQLEHLREFVVFCESANYTQAAKRLYIAQPTLIQHVANLEKHLGLSLVTHDGSPRITETGKLFCAEVSEILRAFDDAVARCKANDEQNRATVRIINLKNSLDLSFIESSSPTECRARPSFVDFDASAYDEFEVLDKGMVDFSLTFANLNWPDLFEGVPLDMYGFIPQPPLPCVALLARDHPLASLEKVPLRALSGYRLVSSNEKFYQRNNQSFVRELKQCGLDPELVLLPTNSIISLIKSNTKYLCLQNEITTSFFS
ncbi:MAG: LysR family transcriptional regulator, partial [Eggerthellaceae bacterium]|nr:LysR family transcriptional regulator [Eggerthellaceae bacterium]